MKKIISILLTLVLVLSVFSAVGLTASAYDDPYYRGISGPTLVNRNGEWQYVKNESVCYDTTLVPYKGCWFLAENGTVAWQRTTLFNYKGTWFYVKGGQVDMNVCTLISYCGTWFYVRNGQVDWKSTTLVKYNGTWFYVKGGQVDWNADTLVNYKGVWFHVKGGSVRFGEGATLCKYNGTWFYVKGGQVDWKADTLVKYNGTWFHVSGGSVHFGEGASLSKYNGTWFYVKAGQVDWNSDTLVKYKGTWFPVKQGMWKTTGQGFSYYNGNWYYYRNGSVTWNYSGIVKVNGRNYRIKNGNVDMSYNNTSKVLVHTHSYTVTGSKTVTCTTGGYTSYTCWCGHHYTQNQAAPGHSYSHYICTRCGMADKAHAYECLKDYVLTNGEVSGANISIQYFDNDYMYDCYGVTYNSSSDILCIAQDYQNDLGTDNFTMIDLESDEGYFSFGSLFCDDEYYVEGRFYGSTFTRNSPVICDDYRGASNKRGDWIEESREMIVENLDFFEYFLEEKLPGLTLSDFGFTAFY